MLGGVDGIAHVLGFAVHLNEGAGLVHQTQRAGLDDVVALLPACAVRLHAAGHQDLAAPDLAHNAGKDGALAQVTGADEIWVLPQGREALRIHQDNLVTVQVLPKEGEPVGHCGGGQPRHRVDAAQRQVPQFLKQGVVHRVVNGVGQLPGRLAHRVAKAGQAHLIGNLHRFGVLAHAGGHREGGEQIGRDAAVLGHLIGLADVAEGRKFEGIPRLALERVVLHG